MTVDSPSFLASSAHALNRAQACEMRSCRLSLMMCVTSHIMTERSFTDLVLALENISFSLTILTGLHAIGLLFSFAKYIGQQATLVLQDSEKRA